MVLRKDGEMGPSPTRNDRASRSLLQKPPAETLSSGFQVLPSRSRQEDEGKQASAGRRCWPVAGRGSQALP